MDKPETLATPDTQDTGQINVRDNWSGHHEWTSQRHWQHPLQLSLTFICPVSCVSGVASVCLHSVSGVAIVCLRSVSCVSDVASVSVFVLCLVCLVLPVSVFVLCPVLPVSVFVLCLVCPVLPVYLACPFLMATSVISNVYLSCVLCVRCCQCLWLVHSWWPLQLSLTFICPVSCVSGVASVSGLSIHDGHFSYL
jgi:hypothetical protein